MQEQAEKLLLQKLLEAIQNAKTDEIPIDRLVRAYILLMKIFSVAEEKILVEYVTSPPTDMG